MRRYSNLRQRSFLPQEARKCHRDIYAFPRMGRGECDPRNEMGVRRIHTQHGYFYYWKVGQISNYRFLRIFDTTKIFTLVGK